VGSPDGCAGCHRLHSAKGEINLLRYGTGTEQSFCQGCHDGSGAATNVVDGRDVNADTSTQNFALRGGGFTNALIDGANAVRGNLYLSGSSYRINKFNQTGSNGGTADSTIPGNAIPVLAPSPAPSASMAVTSTHTMGSATMWGSGTTGSGEAVTLTCTSCHDPHGNGNYRILRNVGTITGGTPIDIAAQWAQVSSAKAYYDSISTTSSRYVYQFTTSAANTFRTGETVNVWSTGAAGATVNKYIAGGTIINIHTANKTIEVAAQKDLTVTANMSAGTSNWSWASSAPTTSQTTLADAISLTLGETTYITPSYPSSIVKVVDNGSDWTFTSAAAQTLFAGQKVTIASANSATAFVVDEAEVLASGLTTTTFKISEPTSGTNATVGIEAGYYIKGIPDALEAAPAATPTGYDKGVAEGETGHKKSYVTGNYFLADDHYYGGTFAGNGNGTATTAGLKTAYIANVSQWCATCHTRYLGNSTGTRSYKNTANGSIDTTFTFRHSSTSAGEGSANCIQCHVAHGSNVKMTGTYTSNLSTPNSSSTAAGQPAGNDGSRLLRVNNRGLCLLCHGMSD
jgi:predicted CXXCH cytochrome family protein